MKRNLFSKCTRSALIGGVVWLGLLPFSLSVSFEGELIQRILLLGVLVIVPLGLALISSSLEKGSPIFALAALIQPYAALAVVISAFIEPGLLAAVLTVPWLVVTGLIGLEGLVGLFRARSDALSSANMSIRAGMIYLPVGSLWLVMSRLGIQPLGFGDTIVLLTAVHFHFSGFAAPLLTGLSGLYLAGSRVRMLFVFVVICVIAGTPLVAAGITFSPAIALVGAIVISLGLFVLAPLNLIWVAPRLPTLGARILLSTSSVTNIPAMVLAIIYAYSIVFQKLIVDIPQMAMTHGVANAFGFSLCGLLTWVMVLRSPRSSVHPLGR